MAWVFEFLFRQPFGLVLACASGLFVLCCAYARNDVCLSRLVFSGILLQIVLVIFWFTTAFNNIVIVKDISYQIITFSLFLAWVSHWGRPNGFVILSSPMKIPVFVYFIAVVLGAYVTPEIFRYYAVEWAVRLGAFVLLFFMMVQFLNTRRRWSIALHTLLGLMLLTSLYEIAQVRGYDVIEWGRIVNVSTFGSSDFFFAFLAFVCPVAVFMALGARTISSGLTYLVIGIVGLYVALDVGGFSSPVLYVPLGLAVVLFEWNFGRIRSFLDQFNIAKSARILSMIVVVIAVIGLLPEDIRNRLFFWQGLGRGNSIIRLYMWWTGGNMWADSPLLGQGLGTSHAVYPFFRPDRYHRIGMSHNTDYVHSEELQYLCEQGIVGFSGWLAMLIVFFWYVFRTLKATSDRSERYIIAGLAAGMICGLYSASTNVSMRWTSTTMTFWYILGLGARRIIGFDNKPPKAVPENPPPRHPVLLAALTSVFAFTFFMEYSVVRADWSLKTTEESGGQTAITKGADTLKHNPYVHSAYYKVAFHYLNESNMKKAMDAFNGLLQIAPNYAQTHQNTGLIYYRLFTSTNQRKYLYQALLEFEWATILENNFENHTKLLQLYTQLLNDLPRSTYHNQFLRWQVTEDAHFLHTTFWRAYAYRSSTPEDRKSLHEEYIQRMDDFNQDYWLYRTDTIRKAQRPQGELRYVMKMAVSCVPKNFNVIQFALGSLLSQTSDTEANLVCLISIIENLERSPESSLILVATRQTLLQRLAESPNDPLLNYATASVSDRMGDDESARKYYASAESANVRGIRFIRAPATGGR